MEEFQAHLNGEVDPSERIGDRPETVAWDPFGENKRSRPNLNQKKDINPLEEEEKSVISKLESKFKSNYSSSKHGTGSKKTGSKKSSQKNEDDVEEEESDSNDPKFELPNECKLEVMKQIKVEKLDDDYLLIAHPFPQMDGEMLLFQQNNKDQTMKDVTVIRDYSLRKRYITPAKNEKKSPYQKKKEMQEDLEKTKLQRLEIDIENPLSTIDW